MPVVILDKETPTGASKLIFDLESKLKFRNSARKNLESISSSTEISPCKHKELKSACEQATYIGTYAPLSSWKEPSLKLSHRSKLCYPKVDNGQMTFLNSSELHESKSLRGLKEPSTGQCVEPDLIFVPSVALDKSGARIGKGGGYYDRYLENKQNVIKIGVCLDEFLIDQIPSELKQVHDVGMDFVLTPKKYFRAKEKLS